MGMAQTRQQGGEENETSGLSSVLDSRGDTLDDDRLDSTAQCITGAISLPPFNSVCVDAEPQSSPSRLAPTRLGIPFIRRVRTLCGDLERPDDGARTWWE